MPFVTTEAMLRDAAERHYAVGAFNVENMEMAMAVISAAEELRAPVILQTTPSTVKYAGLSLYHAIVRTLAEKATIPVALHLDHGSSVALAEEALGVGYTSVMIDGSHEEFPENITMTRTVVEKAKALGIPVEAELGKVGGKEDDLCGGAGGYTDPEDAVTFVSETGISSLAVAIGTAHGVYVGEPVLDVDRLTAIRTALEKKGCAIPLVLHGASGLSTEAVQSCIREGICKVNFATELRIAYTGGTKDYLERDPEVFDPKKYGKEAMARVSAIVKERILVCGADGKA